MVYQIAEWPRLTPHPECPTLLNVVGGSTLLVADGVVVLLQPQPTLAAAPFLCHAILKRGRRGLRTSLRNVSRVKADRDLELRYKIRPQYSGSKYLAEPKTVIKSQRLSLTSTMGFNIANDYLQETAFVVAVVGVALAILATVLRFVATRRAARRPSWEDWFAVLATLFFMAYVAPLLYGEFLSFIVDLYLSPFLRGFHSNVLRTSWIIGKTDPDTRLQL